MCLGTGQGGFVRDVSGPEKAVNGEAESSCQVLSGWRLEPKL